LSAADAVMVGDRIETGVAMGPRTGAAHHPRAERADDARIAEHPADHVIGSVEELTER
jgi:hypothetical protein